MKNILGEVAFLDFLNNRFQEEDLISYGITITFESEEKYILNYQNLKFILEIKKPMSNDEYYIPNFEWDELMFQTVYCYTDKTKSGYLSEFDCYFDDNSTIEFTLKASKLQKTFALSVWDGNIFHFSDNVNDISISRMSQAMSYAYFESEKYIEYFEKYIEYFEKYIEYFEKYIYILLEKLISDYEDLVQESVDLSEAQKVLVLNIDTLLRNREFTIKMIFDDEGRKGTIDYSDTKIMTECINKLEQVLYLAAKKEDVSFFLNRKEFFLPTDEHRHEFWESDTPILLKEIDDKVVSYYKAATYTEISSQKFTYYYQVLEYFFLKVSEKMMLAEIQQEISDNSRSIQVKSEAVLNKLLAMKNKNDELDNLKKVLREYVNDVYIIGLIDKYQLDIHVLNNSDFFKVTPADLTSLTIDKNNGRALPNLAKVIYFIRCLLVHSSDKYDRLECWTPFSENEKIIEPFVPVMKNLAEQVIEGSALAKSNWFES